MSLGQVVVPLRPGSDGDATHRPKDQVYIQVVPPTLYLEKLGQQWMKARGDALPNVSYTLERLPAGYAMYKRPRKKDPNIFDRKFSGCTERIRALC
jgi:hypothetical protein